MTRKLLLKSKSAKDFYNGFTPLKDVLNENKLEEHHIFPNISHIHYTNIAKIVRETATEFNLPYYEYKTTRKAIISHFKHLKALGQKPKYVYN